MYTEGDRNNPYSFDDYVRVRDSFDYYADDPFYQALVKHYCGEEAEAVDQALRDLSQYVSFEFRDLTNAAATLENRIKVTQVRHFDAFNHRVDAIERCAETEALEQAVFELGLFDPARNSSWSRFAKMFLLYQNGEFGVMCPVACTDGMIALARKFDDPSWGDAALGPDAKALLGWARDGAEVDGEHGYAVGAQFLTEIQGGSDVAANLVVSLGCVALGIALARVVFAAN